MKKPNPQIIGVALLSIIFLIHITFFAPKAPKPSPTAKGTESTSIEKKAVAPSKAQYKSFLTKDKSPKKIDCHLQNKNIWIGFSHQGGQIAEVRLKNHKDQNGKIFKLIEKQHIQHHARFTTNSGDLVDTQDLTFSAEIKKVKDGELLIMKTTLKEAPNTWIKQIYFLPTEGYQVNYKIEKSDNLKNIHAPAHFVWKQQLQNKEPHISKSISKTFIKYYQKKSIKDFKTKKVKSSNPQGLNQLKLDQNTHWVALHVPYFLIGLIANKPFQNVGISMQKPNPTAKNSLNEIEFTSVLEDDQELKIYLGPTDYYLLQDVKAKYFHKNYYAGPYIFKFFNTGFVLPLSHWLKGYVNHYLWILLLIILLLTLLQFFFTYQQYLHNLKMKGAKPIIDGLSQGAQKDPQQNLLVMQIQSAIGASMFKSFLYGLAQFPIFIAMVNFTRNQIEFRQLSFLLFKDLSDFDATLSFPFSLPFLGSHLSLLGIVSTLLFFFSSKLKSPPPTTANNDNTAKFLTYIMPLFFLFIFNNAPCSWWIYRIVSNLLELLQHFILKLTVNNKAIEETAFKKAEEALQRLSTSQGQTRTFKRAQKKK